MRRLSFRAFQALLFMLSVTALSGCPLRSGRGDLLGRWAVDVDATVARARHDGLPATSENEIRQVFSGGLLEITRDRLVMRVAGVEGSESVNYSADAPTNGCYWLTVMKAPQAHSYCVSGDELVVRDPGAGLAIVYRRQ